MAPRHQLPLLSGPQHLETSGPQFSGRSGLGSKVSGLGFRKGHMGFLEGLLFGPLEP